MAGSTANYGWYLPGGGSTGTYTPDETADIDKLNQNFVEADADLFAVSQRVTEAEKYYLPTAPGAVLGLVPAGSSAQRDLYWGAPANAAARVALAGKGARWFNTDKGYEERYYSAVADAGASILNSALTAGWFPKPGTKLTVLTTASGSVAGSGAAVYGGLGALPYTRNVPGPDLQVVGNLDRILPAIEGIYRISVEGAVTINSAGVRIIQFDKNASVGFAGSQAFDPSITGAFSHEFTEALSATDYVRVAVAQTSGSGLTFQFRVELEYVSPRRV